METGKDLLTGEAFYKKKSTQKFASRKNQVKYNNQLAAQRRKEREYYTKGLDKNRAILKSILGNAPEATKTRDYLLGAGFNFKLLTHSFSKEGEIWYCIFDMAYTRKEKDSSTYRIAKA